MQMSETSAFFLFALNRSNSPPQYMTEYYMWEIQSNNLYRGKSVVFCEERTDPVKNHVDAACRL